MSQQWQCRAISVMMGRECSRHYEELPASTWTEEGTAKNS